MTGARLLELNRVGIEYRNGRRRFRAVRDVDLHIDRGEILGLVGESGSGKTTIGRSIVGLAPVTSGELRFGGEPIRRRTLADRRALGRRMQMVFQDPYSSLDPAKTIGYTLAEPVRLYERRRADQIERAVAEMLVRVGLPERAADRYPAQFSGGQRQRIAIARALMSAPELIICDEPVSALDLSVQAEVINLIDELRRDLGVSVLFISHDLSLVRHLADRVAVISGGEIVETGDTDTVYERPAHPYTRALLDAAPVPDPVVQRARRAARATAPRHDVGI
ncbi:MAG TPA: ABC transporter ATP-binding protein [Microbacteriaceae bacterium]|nr:ABC transporter ATP-binding protein [Microbacteriaceae bacterium]